MPVNPLAEYLPPTAQAPEAQPKNPLAEFLPEPAPAQPGMVERGMDFVSGFGDVLDQGWSVGGADELGSAIQAGARRLTNAMTGGGDQSFGQLYDDRLKQRQGDLRQFRSDHPIASIVGEIAGSAPTAAVGAGAAGLSKMAPLAKAVLGGGAGGAYGFLSGEGDVGERANDAVIGAAMGAGLGAGGVGVSRAIANRTAKRAGDRTIEEAASLDDLRQGAQANYAVADAAQGAIPTPIYSTFVTKLTSKLKGEGVNAMLHPKAARVLSLMGENADKAPTLQDLQILCQWRSKKGPPRRCKKGPLGGCGLVPVVHGRAPRATRRALNRLTRRRAREGPVGPRGQAWAGWSVQLAVGV